MRFSIPFANLGLAGLAVRAPSSGRDTPILRQARGAQNVVYWGQNGGGRVENNDLASYCTSTSGIDVLVLAFLYRFGRGSNIPSGTIGQSCNISTSGQGQNCEALASAIAKCQAAGVKIILSLGGAAGSYSLQSQADAEAIGQYLWDSYANSGNTAVQRPFGNKFVNGFDFDIEVNGGSSQYYQYMIAKLRCNFAKDPRHTFYITGAPQCPIPEPNMGVIISSSVFDYIFIQFYNNNNYTVPCALGINGNAPFNYKHWTAYIANTPSAKAKLFIGVPASPLAANGSPGGAVYYATPDQLATIVNEYRSDAHFGGVMMWSAGFSDSNVNNGCTYAQEVKNILLYGSPCSSGPPASTVTPTSTSKPTSISKPTSTPTTSTSAPTTTPTGTVPQWGQCGGQGYTGPTLCAAPYTCVYGGAWWSSCR
ncbi:Endochitinase 2 [Tolypocladium paradoxum]|uniref:Endochitinase 2 n=1 Tax=Tolypocladium paradoxum TaxID=94208 RepID=A0A2S4KSE7_9HYPO|nr:Endochitinase 2 [Tolypocladium paradoxum]